MLASLVWSVAALFQKHYNKVGSATFWSTFGALKAQTETAKKNLKVLSLSNKEVKELLLAKKVLSIELTSQGLEVPTSVVESVHPLQKHVENVCKRSALS
jgi:hypothetical protein